MDPIGKSTACNVQASSANPAKAAQTTGVHPSGHANTLTMAMLSNHALSVLNAKEAQGAETEKTLASFAKWAIGSGELHISSDQQPGDIARFRTERNRDVLLIQAKLNERSEYDVLSVGSTRTSEAPVFMTLPQPSAAVSESARPPPALSNLPNELLSQIAGSTGTRGEGVNLSLRRVNRQMRAIADTHLSPKQRFLVENGQILSDGGYSLPAMDSLVMLTPAQQHFALTNGPPLRAAAGYDGRAINRLAGLTPDQQLFALTNGPILHATAGYDGYAINAIATQLPARKNFALTNGPALHTTAGYNGRAINRLASLTSAQQCFALENGPTLHATAGYDGYAINAIATQVPAQQHFALTDGPALHATAGYGGHAINELSRLTPAQQHFALTNGPTLHATAGYDGSAINEIASQISAQQHLK